MTKGIMKWRPDLPNPVQSEGRDEDVRLPVGVDGVGWTLGSGLTPLSRWSRQAVHCQPGDDACKRCSSSCSSVEPSHLPECCEAYNSCCDEYFQACKKCSSLVSKDLFFPEYCCASFTDCCHLITTFTTAIKPPEPVKISTKNQLKVPTVAAPKPSVFPGLKPSQTADLKPLKASSSQSFFESQAPLPSAQDFSVLDTPGAPAFQPSDSRVPLFESPAPQTPVFQPQAPRAPVVQSPARGSRQRAPSPGRAQARPHQRQQGRRRPTEHNPASRQGRVTSRGRVIS
ncbi:uncharacterized protein LOC121857023 [Homarus americanus]|uniref:uncharacterized protein LOC121857023 n=1 Tax=Homarus americanus TaxID=6706 RepID=UPI001C46B0E6|nr:uncharacterized protein LOC121857023 [Homarus americanus]